MKRAIFYAVHLALAGAVGLAQAQEGAPTPSTPPPSDPRLGALEKRQRELEAQLAELAAGKTMVQPLSPVTTSGEFVLQSTDRRFKLILRGYVQADGRFYLDTSPPATSTFLIRRARPILEGTLFKWFGFKIQPDFGLGTATLFDCYAQVKPIKEAVLTIGKFKPPVGLERLQSAATLTFIERALPSNLTASRDIGVMLSGEVAGGTLSYQLALLNGAPDGVNGNADNNDEKDFAARVFVHPLRPLGIASLHNLGVGFAYEGGTHSGTAAAPTLPSYSTPAQLTFFTFVGDGTVPNTVIAAGNETRLLPQGYWYVGPVSLMAEYALASYRVQKGTQAAHELDFSAWQVAGSFVFKGHPTYDGVIVDRPVGPGGGWGALEIAARYGEQHDDRSAFPFALANSAQSAQAVHAGTGALNWYANRGFKIQVNLEFAEFVGGGIPPAGSIFANRGSETTLLVQTQVAF